MNCIKPTCLLAVIGFKTSEKLGFVVESPCLETENAPRGALAEGTISVDFRTGYFPEIRLFGGFWRSSEPIQTAAERVGVASENVRMASERDGASQKRVRRRSGRVRTTFGCVGTPSGWGRMARGGGNAKGRGSGIEDERVALNRDAYFAGDVEELGQLSNPI